MEGGGLEEGAFFSKESGWLKEKGESEGGGKSMRGICSLLKIDLSFS